MALLEGMVSHKIEFSALYLYTAAIVNMPTVLCEQSVWSRNSNWIYFSLWFEILYMIENSK